MMNKLLWVFIILMYVIWAGDYFIFRYAGRRFTADHGQALCLRVQALDGQPCEYNRK